jgi:choline-glycine betaine transporter
MKETVLSKAAKVIFIICVVLFFMQETSLGAINTIKNIIINNFLLIIIITILILVWKIKVKGGKIKW